MPFYVLFILMFFMQHHPLFTHHPFRKRKSLPPHLDFIFSSCRFISNNIICAPPLLPQGGLQRAPQEGFRTAKNRLSGLWGASGVSGPLLATFSGSLWLHLWSWGLSGVLFGCIWGLFGLLFQPPWAHLLQKFGHHFCFTCRCEFKTCFICLFHFDFLEISI